MRRSLLYGLAFLMLIPHARAEESGAESFATFSECKAHYEALKEQEMQKLIEKKKQMGAGMPGFVYSRKKRGIESDFESRLENCKAITST